MTRLLLDFLDPTRDKRELTSEWMLRSLRSPYGAAHPRSDLFATVFHPMRHSHESQSRRDLGERKAKLRLERTSRSFAGGGSRQISAERATRRPDWFLLLTLGELRRVRVESLPSQTPNT